MVWKLIPFTKGGVGRGKERKIKGWGAGLGFRWWSGGGWSGSSYFVRACTMLAQCYDRVCQTLNTSLLSRCDICAWVFTFVSNCPRPIKVFTLVGVGVALHVCNTRINERNHYKRQLLHRDNCSGSSPKSFFFSNQHHISGSLNRSKKQLAMARGLFLSPPHFHKLPH